jgi:hypothetical protein
VELYLIFFDLHASPAPIALLATHEIVIYLGNIDLHPGRKSFYDCGQAWTMGFPSGEKAEHTRNVLPVLIRKCSFLRSTAIFQSGFAIPIHYPILTREEQ